MFKNSLVILALFASGFCFAQEVKSVRITDLEKTIAESKTPMIINFWATWCKPCIEEIPYFQSEALAYSKDSVQLILVSLDFKENYPAGVRSFMMKNKIAVPVMWLNETDADYFCPKVDAAWSGAIPATLFINNKKGYRKFVEESLSPAELKAEIMAIL